MKKLFISILSVLACGLIIAAPVFADTKCTVTSIIGNSVCDKDGNLLRENDSPTKDGEYSCSCDHGKGDSITGLLGRVVDFLSIGVVVVGAIGISIVGVQYLTAGGDVDKTKKAKRRLLEIVIGLIAYVLLYAILKWLNVA